MPALALISVPAHGPKTAPSFGLRRWSDPLPELSIVALAVPNDAVQLPVVVRAHPRTVVVIHLQRGEEEAGADTRRRRSEQPSPPSVASADTKLRTIETVDVVDVRGACG
jgi:hypothetical protein